MGRQAEMQFDFVARYEIEQLDRIERLGAVRVLGFPGASAINPQQELADGPILRVTGESGDTWVGVFLGEQYGVPPAASSRVIGWPDEISFCVVHKGGAIVVRADEPTDTYEVDAFPITGTFVVPERGIVLFTDFTTLSAYTSDGKLWRSRRLALDDLRIDDVTDDTIQLSGFFGGHGLEQFTVATSTGEASDLPFQPPE